MRDPLSSVRHLFLKHGQKLDGIENLDGCVSKIPGISRNDALRPRQPTCLFQDCVFKIGNFALESLFDHSAIHGRNLEELKQAMDCIARSSFGEGLSQEIIHGGERCGAEKSVNHRLLNQSKNSRRRLHERLSIEENIQDHIGVEDDPQRYLFRRCFL